MYTVINIKINQYPMNEVFLQGNLARKPYVGEGDYGKYAYLTVATTTKVKNEEYTDFIECSASKKGAEIASKLKKGDSVIVYGKAKSKKRQTDSGDSYTQIYISARRLWTPEKIQTTQFQGKKQQPEKQAPQKTQQQVISPDQELPPTDVYENDQEAY